MVEAVPGASRQSDRHSDRSVPCHRTARFLHLSMARSAFHSPTRHVFFVLAALAVLMSSIDSTIVAVAIPQLQTALDAPLTAVGWTLTAYQLIQMVMFPLAGKLSDTLGRKRVFLFCVATFTVGSLLCGLAPSIWTLIPARVLQAVGGGGLMPSAVGVVSDQYRNRRAQAIGLFTSVFPVGGIVGPNLGGFILEHWTWRDLFFINLPIGVVVLVGVALLLESSNERAVRHIDVLGLVLYAGGITTLMAVMTAVGDDPALWRSVVPWGGLVISVVMLALFVVHIRRAEDPVMDFNLLARHPFLAANLFNLLFGAASFGFFSFIPLYAVSRFGMSPFESGAVLTGRALTIIATSTLASLYVIRTGYRLPMLAGMGIVAVSLVLLGQGWTEAQVGPVTIGKFWLLSAMLALSGLGNGLANPSSNNAALDLAPRQTAALTGIRGMFRLTGGALSISGIVLALTFFPDTGVGLSKIFLALAVIMLAAMPLALLIPDTARQRWVKEHEAEVAPSAGQPGRGAAATEPAARPVAVAPEPRRGDA